MAIEKSKKMGVQCHFDECTVLFIYRLQNSLATPLLQLTWMEMGEVLFIVVSHFDTCAKNAKYTRRS